MKMLLETEMAGIVMGVVRVLAWAQAAPLVSDRMIPARIRAAMSVPLGFAISASWAPVTYDQLFQRIPWEIALGLLVGFASRLVFLGAEFGGQLIGVQLGLGFAQSYDPLSGEEALAMRSIAGVLAGFAFLAADGLGVTIRALSIQGLSDRIDASILDEMFRLSGSVVNSGFRMAAPMLLAGLSANVAVALAARAAPALNAFSVMLALFLIVGGLVLFGTLGPLTQEIETIGRMATEAPWRLFGR